MSALTSTLVSLLGAVLVAVLTHLFSARRNREDELAELRLKAYADFISAASRIAAARRSGRRADDLDELASLNDAKARIAICADLPVVEALGRFWEAGGTLEREDEILAFTALCLRMRESVGNVKDEVLGFHLSETLFKLEPSAYSFRKPADSKK